VKQTCDVMAGLKDSVTLALKEGGLRNRSRIRVLMLEVVLSAVTLIRFSSLFSSSAFLPCRDSRSFFMYP